MERILKKLKNKQNLSFDESKSAFESMMSGKLKEEEILSFLTSSSAKEKLQMKLQVEFMF